MAIYNEKHQEIPDPTPVEMPLGYEKPESLESMIARMIRTTSNLAAKTNHVETFEESDDFDDDDTDLKSPYQMTDMEEEEPRYVRANSEQRSTQNTTQTTAQKPQTVPPVQTVEKTAETVGNAQA